MKYRVIGTDPKTRREVSVLSLGATHFGTATDEATSFAILDRYVEAGGTFIDTSGNYAFWANGTQGGARTARNSGGLLGPAAIPGGFSELFMSDVFAPNVASIACLPASVWRRYVVHGSTVFLSSGMTFGGRRVVGSRSSIGAGGSARSARQGGTADSTGSASPADAS